MTTSDPDAPRRWLRGRRPAPPPVVERLVAEQLALHDPGEGGVPARLAFAGLEALRSVAAGPGDRASAGPLLAADGLLTYAVEAAAGDGRGALTALLEALDVGRFQGLLSEPDPDR